MSALTSAQLHVKRSSTRLHAPPGGVSSLSFGCGGLGSTSPAEEVPHTKEEPAFSHPSSSSRYAPPPTGYSNNNASSGYPGYSTPQHDPAPHNSYAPPQQQSYQQQPYQAQVYQHQPYQQQQPAYNPNSYGNNSFSNPNYAATNNGLQVGRPPSSRSSCHSSSSSRSWGSQPPLTSSKRDQNWEKKRQLWLARKNSGTFGESCPPTSTSTWSAGHVLDDGANPPSPLSKFMHQHAQQQQQQQPPPSPTAEFQRMGTASSTRSSFVPQSYLTPGPTVAAGSSYSRRESRGGLSTASSTSSSGGRRLQPPGGHCQWSLG